MDLLRRDAVIFKRRLANTIRGFDRSIVDNTRTCCNRFIHTGILTGDVAVFKSHVFNRKTKCH